jgi:putative ATPase
MQVPLAERMRPQQLDDLAGQEHLTGPHSILRVSIDRKSIPSMILWGPSGTGKTTIAAIIARETGLPFIALSAISAGVKDVREAIDTASRQDGTILFIDEIHRFNKGQQDALLGAVEKGLITLIGATTENPSFEVNSALLSRCQVFVLKPLQATDLSGLLHKAIRTDPEMQSRDIVLKEEEALLRISGGDARKLMNLLELVVRASAETPLVITNDLVMRAAQQTVALYDKKGEQHYDIISAFIKSIRGSDPNAALYWLARMIEGGETVRFIARRMLILASEDIGNANPTALVLANATFEAADKIGFPEARIILAQCATYLAASPKSNASYMGIEAALSTVRKTGDLPVPLPIRNAPTGLMKELGYSDGYQYAHDYPMNFAAMEFLPEALSGTTLFRPGHNAREEEMRRFLQERWKEKYGY